MAILYYSKINVNSNIFSVYEGEISIQDIMNSVYKSLDDKKEYKKTEISEFYDKENRQMRSVELTEIYNFSELNKSKVNDKKFITGKLVRRYPVFSEKFDEKSRVSKPVVLDDNSISTSFYFDLESEIICFFVRNKFGYKQFNHAFQNLLDTHIVDVGFEVILLTDPYKAQERLKMLHKVRKIKSTIIPPNANEEALQELYDRNTEQLKQGNITRQTSIFESNKKSEKGLNVHSPVVKETLEVSEVYMQKGYGKLEVEGESKDGTTFRYDSEKDSPYNTSIAEDDKDDFRKLIKSAQKGIKLFLARKGKTIVDKISTAIENLDDSNNLE